MLKRRLVRAFINSAYDKDRMREKSEKEQVQNILKDVEKSYVSIVDTMKRDEAWLDKNADVDFTARNNARMMNQKLALCCMIPLMRGVNTETVCQSLGMVVGMSVFNKGFRQDIKDIVANGLLSTTNLDYDTLRDNDSKLIPVIDGLFKKGRDGRVPYTDRTLAANNVALTMRYYDTMQDMSLSEEERSNITDNFLKQRKELYDLGEIDGISARDINKATEKTINILAKSDVKYRKYFEVTSDKNYTEPKYYTDENYVTDRLGVEVFSDVRRPRLFVDSTRDLVSDFSDDIANTFENDKDISVPMSSYLQAVSEIYPDEESTGLSFDESKVDEKLKDKYKLQMIEIMDDSKLEDTRLFTAKFFEGVSLASNKNFDLYVEVQTEMKDLFRRQQDENSYENEHQETEYEDDSYDNDDDYDYDM
jgi:hypothetical protein